ILRRLILPLLKKITTITTVAKAGKHLCMKIPSIKLRFRMILILISTGFPIRLTNVLLTGELQRDEDVPKPKKKKLHKKLPVSLKELNLTLIPMKSSPNFMKNSTQRPKSSIISKNRNILLKDTQTLPVHPNTI